MLKQMLHLNPIDLKSKSECIRLKSKSECILVRFSLNESCINSDCGRHFIVLSIVMSY